MGGAMNQKTSLMNDPGPGFKWPVDATITVAAPANELWKVISMPGNLEYCHPFCKSNPVLNWPGHGSRDEVHYLNGLIYERRFCDWIDGVGYDLNIGRRDGPRSFVSWRIAAENGDRSSLRIVVYPYVLQQLPVFARWAPHLLRVRPMLRRYLSSVVKGFEWFMTHGEAVPRNQWGSHPWFSVPAIDIEVKTRKH